MPGGPKPGGGPGLSTPGGHAKPPHRGGGEPRGGRQHHPPYHQQHHQGPPPGGPGGRSEEKISDSEVSVSQTYASVSLRWRRPPLFPSLPLPALHFVGDRKERLRAGDEEGRGRLPEREADGVGPLAGPCGWPPDWRSSRGGGLKVMLSYGAPY